jgi:hypothetical protein
MSTSKINKLSRRWCSPIQGAYGGDLSEGMGVFPKVCTGGGSGLRSNGGVDSGLSAVAGEFQHATLE